MNHGCRTLIVALPASRAAASFAMGQTGPDALFESPFDDK